MSDGDNSRPWEETASGLPPDWTVRPLADLVDERGISYGIVQPGHHVEEGVPIVRVNNIRDGRIVTHDVLRVSQDTAEKYSRTRLRGGEVLLTLVGSLGQSAVVPEELHGWNVARAVGVLPVKRGIDPRWIEICLRSAHVQHLIKTWATTTVQATLNLSDVAKLPIPLPPRSEREEITSVIAALDDKIELNRRMNRTLEEMARALFKSWFVDFDPVRAKAAGRQPAGMDAETAALFPSKFAESEMGEIPDGWRIGQGRMLFDHSKQAVNPSEHPEEEFDHYSIPAFDERKRPKTEYGSSIRSNKYLAPPQAVLLSKLNPHLPRVWLPAGRGIRRSICSTEFLVTVPHRIEDRPYLYTLLSSEHFLVLFASMVGGTTGSHQRVRPEHVLTMEIVLPAEAVRTAFGVVVEPMFVLAASLMVESERLTAVRDALLPKLLSGEICTSVAEVAGVQAVGI